MPPGRQLRVGRVSQRAPREGGEHTLFHEGERAVQRRAGTERVAAQIGRNIAAFVPAEFGAFLNRQPFAVVASQDHRGRVWASLIAAGAGFARAVDDRRILLAGMPASGDPLEGALDLPHARIGVLAIEPGTRQRIRLNGLARRTGDGVLLTVAEAFGNCSKYIQRRVPAGRLTGPAAASPRRSTALDARQAALVRRADTFFIATAHPGRGADASHRGGRPGFAEVAAGGRRRLTVRLGGEVVADSRAPLAVFETGFAPRWYVPRGDVSRGVLHDDPLRTLCPYKGVARYFDVVAGGRRAVTAAWSYPEALPESARLTGYVSFDPAQLELTLDGERLLPAEGQRVIATGTDRGLTVA